MRRTSQKARRSCARLASPVPGRTQNRPKTPLRTLRGILAYQRRAPQGRDCSFPYSTSAPAYVPRPTPPWGCGELVRVLGSAWLDLEGSTWCARTAASTAASRLSRAACDTLKNGISKVEQKEMLSYYPRQLQHRSTPLQEKTLSTTPFSPARQFCSVAWSSSSNPSTEPHISKIVRTHNFSFCTTAPALPTQHYSGGKH